MEQNQNDAGEPGGQSRSNAGLGLAPERAEVARLDDGEAWSFCRTVMSDGRDIRQWHPDEGYEMQSARMDAQAARRGDQLMEMVRRLLAAERERCAAWVDARRDAFCEAHGSIDPDTGTLEFGRGAHAEAKSEYVGELEEIAAGLRALRA